MTPPSFSSYKEFMAETFDDGDELCFHGCRGEVVVIQSVTNHGKSTAIRNSGLCLASGREFSPFVPAGTPRKVLLLNFEGSGRRFQNDIEVMAEAFSNVEIALIEMNFFPVHAPKMDDEPLSLSRHMAQVKSEL